MMKFRQTSILSLVMSDASVACVELHTRAGAVHIHQTGMFDPGAGATLDTPDALGAALAMFLRERGFTARHAVVGVPARWLMAMERDVPAVPVEQGEAILRLQMERRGAGDGAELVFDYAGTLSGLREPGRVLLVGMMRRKLEQITRAIDAAGLKLVGVTSTSLALALFEPKAAHGQTMLLIGRGSAEVVSVTDGVPRMIRHVLMGASTMTQVGQELRRALVMTSNGSNNGTAPELSTWQTGGLSTAQVEALSDALGARLSARSVSVSLGVNAPAALSEFAPAVAVGVVGLKRALPIDLAHSRLVQKVASRFGRRGAWGVACGVVALLALGGLYVDVLQRQSETDAMAAQLTQIAPDLESAQVSLARFSTARGYFESRPLMLDGMLALTKTFRDDEPIWITNFALRDTFAGQMQGKANEQRHVLAVLDRMKKIAAFGNVRLIDMRDAGGKTREVPRGMIVRSRLTRSCINRTVGDRRVNGRSSDGNRQQNPVARRSSRGGCIVSTQHQKQDQERTADLPHVTSCGASRQVTGDGTRGIGGDEARAQCGGTGVVSRAHEWIAARRGATCDDAC